MHARPFRIGVALLAALAWFVTAVGGWADVGDAVAGTAAAALQARRGTDPAQRSPLRARPLAEGDEFGLPSQISVVGDQLLLLDRYRDEAVVLLDRHSGTITRSYGRAGEGPGEFRSPWSALWDEGKLAVLDPGLNRITWLAPDRESPTFSLEGTTRISAEPIVTGFALAPDESFVVTGFMRTGRLAQMDRNGAIVTSLGLAPATDGLSPERRSEAQQGTLRGTPDGRRFVLTSRFASHIEVVDASTMTATTIWGPERFQPRAGRYETRFGYLDSAPMRDGFLALYSGRTRDEFPGRANYGAEVHEFGWDGELRAVYELDSDVISLAWSEADRRLYAVRHDPVPGVVVYGLE
jgi:hypothetical protein